MQKAQRMPSDRFEEEPMQQYPLSNFSSKQQTAYDSDEIQVYPIEEPGDESMQYDNQRPSYNKQPTYGDGQKKAPFGRSPASIGEQEREKNNNFGSGREAIDEHHPFTQKNSLS